MIAFKSIPFCDDSSGKQSLFSDEVQVEEGKGEAAGSDLEEHVHTLDGKKWLVTQESVCLCDSTYLRRTLLGVLSVGMRCRWRPLLLMLRRCR